LAAEVSGGKPGFLTQRFLDLKLTSRSKAIESKIIGPLKSLRVRKVGLPPLTWPAGSVGKYGAFQ